MKKVVLVHPNHKNTLDCRLDPPLGLLYIAYNLLLHDIEVEICDLSGYDHYDIPYADVYGITVYITSIDETKKIIKKCKKVNPDSKIVVGGAHPTTRPNDFPYVDHVVRGYGEVALVDIVNGIERNHIVIGKEPEDLFLWPAYDLIEPKSYHRKIAEQTSLPLLTSRGCPFKCSFCGLEQMHKLLGYNVRFDKTDNVICQIERIKAMGINCINFQDDIFVIQTKRLFKILDAVKEMNMKFRCMGRAGINNEKVYEKLSECGCETISFGLESGSQYILDRMRKQVKVQDNYNTIRLAKKYKIPSRAFFVIFFPGETRETLEETKEFILKSEPDQVFVSKMVPYPGTHVGDNPKQYGITWLSNDYSQYYQVSKNGMGGITFDTQWLSRFEMRDLELEFRAFIKSYMQSKLSDSLQDYEKILYKKG